MSGEHIDSCFTAASLVAVVAIMEAVVVTERLAMQTNGFRTFVASSEMGGRASVLHV